MAKFTEPSWAQRVIATAAGIPTGCLAVCLDDDMKICYMDLKTRRQYIVDKKNGKVLNA